MHAQAIMLTYNGILSLAQWRRLVAFVTSNLKKWGVKHWCATWEQGESGLMHAHLYLQFHKTVDRRAQYFAFEGKAPRVDPNDYCGEGPVWKANSLFPSLNCNVARLAGR